MSSPLRILVATSNPHKLDEIRAVFAAEQAAASIIRPPLPSEGEGRGEGLSLPPPAAVDLLSLADLPHSIAEPVEDQSTFEGNAILKARHYAQATETWCLADDSGLEVDALGGAPGVRSARYAGVTGPRSVVDPANNTLLLRNLAGVPAERRTARFVCAMALVAPPDADAGKWLVRHPAILVHVVAPDPAGRILAQVRGTVEGRILLPEETADPAQPHRGRGTSGFGYDPLFFVPERGRTMAELTPDQKNAISHRGRAARALWQEMRGWGTRADSDAT